MNLTLNGRHIEILLPVSTVTCQPLSASRFAAAHQILCESDYWRPSWRYVNFQDGGRHPCFISCTAVMDHPRRVVDDVSFVITNSGRSYTTCGRQTLLERNCTIRHMCCIITDAEVLLKQAEVKRYKNEDWRLRMKNFGIGPKLMRPKWSLDLAVNGALYL